MPSTLTNPNRRLQVYFFKDYCSILGSLVGLLGPSRLTHVAVELDGIVYDLRYPNGSVLYMVEEYPNEPYLKVPVDTIDDLPLELPDIVLNQRLDLIDGILNRISRILSVRYRLTTPVITCVSMVNIILNHNLNTNEFNGYTPDDLYEQVRRRTTRSIQGPIGVHGNQD